jgi:multidrug efflux pump subunit AcrB
VKVGIAGRIAHTFLGSKLTPLIVVASLAVGSLALLATPREEEPQIRVPMIDVAVAWPGVDPEEIAGRVTTPIEKAMWGLSGVEHVYSTSRPGFSLVTVRFRVNESNEASLVKVSERLSTVRSRLPREAYEPTVELHSIDDVPFLALTLSSPVLSHGALRTLASELAQELAEIPETTRARVIGGEPRVVRVEPDLDRMAAAGLSWSDLSGAIAAGAGRASAGSAVRGGAEKAIEVGPTYRSASDIEGLVLARRGTGVLLLRDVARVIDGPAEITNLVFFLTGPSRATADRPAGREFPAVTVALAKRPGANATDLARRALAKLDELRPKLLPAGVSVDVTRNYGETADEKSKELVEHLLIATLSVVALISLAMGWRAGAVVGIAVPVTLALTLFIYWLFGYTLNRVTLFALIFSIGILVDDAIVVVENIERHFAGRKGLSLARIAVEAVDEVGNPTILATFTVIAAILPLAFVRGLMGPYMRPIPTGASAAMIFSLAVAFIVSPWAAYRIFRKKAERGELHEEELREGLSTRLYRRWMSSLIRRPAARWSFFAGVLAILLASLGLVAAGLVKVKMLPFDNKSELQVLVDHDPGTPLETTVETARALGRYLATVPEVADVEIYAGEAAPHNFNGLVRHYFLRRSPTGADLQVNLASKHDRDSQSHDIAKRLRPELQRIGNARGARVKIVEIPPGPPVLDTLVAEIYGPSVAAREQIAAQVKGVFETTGGIVDVDDTLDAPSTRSRIEVDREKAGLAGLPPAAVVEAAASSGAGREVARIESPSSREPVPVELVLSAIDRASISRRLSLRMTNSEGKSVSLSSLATVVDEPVPQGIFHKDLKPVVYVFGDLAGERESPVYAISAVNEKLDALDMPGGGRIERHSIDQPETSDRPAMKWDGEWQITYEVFRDMGIAFAVVLVLIAILVVGWFQSWTVPLAILLPIPLSLIGILPGHWIFGSFFTATSMIGFIAGAGIIVRNSIILVDFIELKVRQGLPLEDAVVDAGAIRFRPMLLTAAAVVVGSLVILFDPIFQGLALSLMWGEIAATLLSRMAVPVVYYLVARHGRADELREEGLEAATA